MAKSIEELTAGFGQSAADAEGPAPVMGVDALKDPLFLAQVRRYYRSYKNKTFSSDDEMIRFYRQDQISEDANLTDKALTALGGIDDGEDERQLKRVLKETHRSIPMDLEDWGHYVGSTLIDPINLIGGAGAVAKTAQGVRAGQTVGRALLGTAGKGFLDGAIAKEAGEQAIIGGLTGAAASTIDQNTDQRLGLQEDFNVGRLGLETAIGAGAGALGGAVLGGGMAALGARKLANKQIEILGKLGWSEADIASMTAKEAEHRITKKISPEPAAPEGGFTMDESGMAVPAGEAAAPTAGPRKRTPDIDTNEIDIDIIDAEIERADRDLRKIKRDTPDEVETISAGHSYLNNLQAARALLPRVQALSEKDLKNLEGNDLAAEATTMSRLTRVRNLKHLYQDIIENPGENSVSRFLAAAEKEGISTAEKDANPKGDKVKDDPVATPDTPIEVDPATAGSVDLAGGAPAEITPEAAAPKKASRKNAAITPEVQTKADSAWDTISADIGDMSAIANHPEILRELVSLIHPEDADIDDILRAIEKRAKGETPFKAEIVVGGKGTGISRPEADAANLLSKWMRKKDPSLTEDVADVLARNEIIRKRNVEDAPLRGTDPERAIDVTAGQTNSGKPQEFLKPASKDGTIEPVNVPKRMRGKTNLKVFEGMKSAAEHAHRKVEIDSEGYVVNELTKGVVQRVDKKTGEVIDVVEKSKVGRTTKVENMDPVAYRGDRNTRVADDINPGLVDRSLDAGKWTGKTVWYNPVDRKTYAHFENIKGTSAPGKGRRAERRVAADRDRRAAERAEKRATADKAQKVAESGTVAAKLEKVLAEKPKTYAEVIAQLAKANEAQSLAEAAVIDPPPAPVEAPRVIPELPIRSAKGNVAIRHTEDGEVRVLTDKQIADGKGLANIIGKSHPDEWEYGYADATSNKTARATFEAVDINDAANIEPPVSKPPTISMAEASGRVLSFGQSDIDRLSMELNPRGVASSPDAVKQGFTVGRVINQFFEDASNGLATHNDLWRLFDDLNGMIGWGDRASHFAASKLLANVSKLINDFAPERPIWSTGKSAEAITQLRKLGNVFDAAEFKEAMDMVERMIAANDGNAPQFIPDTINSSFTDPRSGSTVSLNSRTPIFPRTAILLHEMGHWGYSNILNPEDALFFWDSMGKYYDGVGALKTDAIERRVPLGGGAADESGAIKTTNELSSPQEFFANQFSMWAMQERASLIIQDESFWRRVAIKIHSAYLKYFKREAIDKDLVPLFEKIFPDAQANKAAPEPGVSGPKTVSGAAVWDHHQQLTSTMAVFNERLDEAALGSLYPDDLIEAATDLQRALYSVGGFNMLQSYKPLAQGLAAKLSEIINSSEPIEDIITKLENASMASPFEDTKKFSLTDGVTVINAKLRRAFNAIPDEPQMLGDKGEFVDRKGFLGGKVRVQRRKIGDQKGFEKKIEEIISGASNVLNFPKADRVAAEVAPDVTLPFKTASTRQIAEELEAFKGTDYAVQLAHELMQRRKAEPLDPKATKLFIADADVFRAAKREERDYAGITSDDGVAASARPTIREAQTALTHRDPEIQGVMRTLFYRLANLADVAATDSGKVLDTDLIAALAGTVPDEAGMVFNGAGTGEFNLLRSQLRRVAKQLTTDEGDHADILREVIDMIARAKGDRLDGLADEVLNIASDLEGRPRPTKIAEKYVDAVAYALNGLIGRKDMKARLPNIDNYGSMFGSPDVGPPPKTSGIGSVVGLDARASYDAASPARRRAIANFVGKDSLGFDGSKPITFFVRGVASDLEEALTPMVPSEFGKVIRFHDGPDAASDELIDKVLDHVADKSGDQSDQFFLAAELAEELRRYEDELNYQKFILEDAEADRGKPGYFQIVSDARAQVRDVQDTLNAIAEELKGLVPAKVVEGNISQPIYVKMRNPLDIRYGLDSEDFSGILDEFANFAVDSGLALDVEQVEKAVLRIEDADHLTDVEVHEWMGSLIEHGSGTPEQVKELVNQALKAMGYDGIITSKHYVAFDPEQIKHVNSHNFNDSPFLWGEMADADINMGSINGGIVEQAVFRRNMDVNFGPLAEVLEKNGMPKELSAAMGAMTKKKKLPTREGKIIKEASTADIFLAPNSERARKNGLHWLADWVAPENGTGHFERIASDLGGYLMPITRAMNALPDAKQGLGGWVEHGVLGRQPRSHGKIISAIRRGNISALNKEEIAAYNLVRKSFSDIMTKMVDAGIMTGQGIPKNYFPQVWSKEKILQNSEEFVRGLSVYLLREAKADVPPRELDAATAMAKAQKIHDNITAEDGVYIPPTNSNGGEITGDHIDYQRMIRLDQDEVSLKILEPFLEDNLGAIVSKYFDTAVRKLDVVKKFGHGAHGIHDYLQVVEGGKDAIVKLLMTNKVFTRGIAATEPDGNRVMFDLKREVEMPFAGRPDLARSAADVIDSLKTAGQIKAFLTRMSKAEEIDDTYLRRVDAIANAVMDARAMPHTLHQQEYEHARQMMRVIQRKPIDGGHASSDTMNRGYRFLRNFNSVTLLGFTLLSSLGDSVMPLLKSGDFGAWTEGLRKTMRRDPEYRQMMSNIGVSIENILHERMVGLYGSGSSKFTTGFFNATGLTPWTNLMREVSGTVGYEWFKKEMKTAIEAFNPRLPIADQPPAFAIAYRNLKTYGLDHLLANNVSIDTPTALSDIPELRHAIIKFANKTVFTPNADDLPLKAQTPLGAVLYQLKSFPLMMARNSKEILQGAGYWSSGTPDKNARDLGPLLALMTAAPAAGFAVNNIKDVVQGRGGEDANEHKPRQRLLTDVAIVGDIAQAAGMDPEDPGVMNHILGQYIQGMMMIGGFGLIGDMILSSAESVDNGAYGATRVASTIFGPSVGTFMSAFNVAAGASDATKDILGVNDNSSNAKERQAMREIIGRIPVVGGVKSLKEGIVDATAGPSSRG